MNINGVKIVTADVQGSLESALKNTCALGVISSPSRASGTATKQITIAYVPEEWPVDAERVFEVNRLAARAGNMVTTGFRSVIFGVGPKTLPLLSKPTLRKISRAKIRALLKLVCLKRITCITARLLMRRGDRSRYLG